MTTYKHTLTEVEGLCGVTLDGVDDTLAKCLMLDDDRVILPKDTPPALAGSVARCAFSGDGVEFAGMSLGTMPVYRRKS